MGATDNTQRGGVLVAVVAGQPVAVVEQAARLAEDLDLPLVCAHVDVNRYLVSSYVDGTVVALPYDPDLPEVEEEKFDPELEAHLRDVLRPIGVRYSLEQLAGEHPRILQRLDRRSSGTPSESPCDRRAVGPGRRRGPAALGRSAGIVP